MTLTQWTNKVDSLVQDKHEMGVFDILGDFMSADMYAEGLTPVEAVEQLEDDIAEGLNDLQEMSDAMGF